MYKYEAHVPTEQFGFISVTVEGSAHDAILAYKELSRLWNRGEGIGMKEFAKILVEYISTGQIAMGGDYEFSTNEKLLLNEVKKLMRKDK